MKAEILQFVQEKTKELIQAPTCSAEARKAAEQWLASVGTEREAEETKAYLTELEEDIVTVDGLIAFAESEAGAEVFGADHAKEVAAQAGAVYCDCPACSAVEAILEKKEFLL